MTAMRLTWYIFSITTLFIAVVVWHRLHIVDWLMVWSSLGSWFLARRPAR